jgi:hypothetical protein
MVELLWGPRPRSPDERFYTVVPVEERRFPSHRWLVPASEFRHRSRGKDDRFPVSEWELVLFRGDLATRDARVARSLHDYRLW